MENTLNSRTFIQARGHSLWILSCLSAAVLTACGGGGGGGGGGDAPSTGAGTAPSVGSTGGGSGGGTSGGSGGGTGVGGTSGSSGGSTGAGGAGSGSSGTGSSGGGTSGGSDSGTGGGGTSGSDTGSDTGSGSTALRIEPNDSYPKSLTLAWVKRSAQAASSQWPLGAAPTWVDLGPLPEQASAAPSGATFKGETAGVQRSVPSSTSSTASALNWVTLADGRQVGAAVFHSPAASSVRLSVGVDALPEGAVLRFYGANAQGLSEHSHEAIAQLRETHLKNGVDAQHARQVFSGVLSGSQATLEIELPAGVDITAVRISEPVLDHLWDDIWGQSSGGFALKNRAVDMPTNNSRIGVAQSCHINIVCKDGDYSNTNQSRAVAKYLFRYKTVNNVNWCSGTLVNNTREDHTPYFLTAHHCVKDADVTSIATYWFFRSAVCAANTNVPTTTKEVTGGAALLYSNESNDTTLLRLNNPPPRGVLFSGLYTGPLNLGDTVRSVHHPRGDLQKFSQGKYEAFGSVVWLSDDKIRLSTFLSREHESNYFAIKPTHGATEKGSSGSGLLARHNNRDYLVGVFTGGDADCTKPHEFEAYGRLSRAWDNADAQGKTLKEFLAP